MEKNRNFLIILAILLLSFIYIGDASAKPVKICDYKKYESKVNASGKISNEIYYDVSKGKSGFAVNSTMNPIDFETFKNQWTDKEWAKTENASSYEKFVCPPLQCIREKGIFIITKEGKFGGTEIAKGIFECPAGEYKTKAGKNDKGQEINYNIFKLIKNDFFTEEALKNAIKNVPSSVYMNNSQINGQWSNESNILSASVASALYEPIRKKYFSEEKEIPVFIKTFIAAELSNDNNSKILSEAFKEKLEEDHNNGTINDETYESKKDIVDNNYNWGSGTGYSVTKEYKEQIDTFIGSTVKETVSEADCSSILGEDMTILVKNLLNFIRFLGPALVIVFTIIEFVGAVFSADASLTKPLGRLIRRLIAAALLFFLPTLLIPLFNYLHITMSETCFNLLK